jgi:hypothetical protein
MNLRNLKKNNAEVKTVLSAIPASSGTVAADAAVLNKRMKKLKKKENMIHLITIELDFGCVRAGDEPAANAGARIRSQPRPPTLNLMEVNHESLLQSM